MIHCHDSDEEQEEDEDMLLLTCVLIGEYLCSEKDKRPTFCFSNRREWEWHIAEL